MADARAPLRALVAALRRTWRTRTGKLMVLLVLVGLWQTLVLVIPALYYLIPASRALTRRLVYSVRAKLAAFYLYAALFPLLIFVTAVLLLGYVTLAQTSARIVEQRLDREVEWGEQCAGRAERAYWRTRAQGHDAGVAADSALRAGWGGAPQRTRCWVRRDAEVLAARGAPRPADFAVPRWLGDDAFVGLTAVDSMHLDLRTRTPLRDGTARIELGSVLPIDNGLLNRGLAGALDVVRGGVGAPDRGRYEFSAKSDSSVIEEGVVAFFSRGGNLGGGAARMHLDPKDWRGVPRDSLRDRMAMSLERRLGTAPPDSVFRDDPSLAPWHLRSRWGLLSWLYLPNPVDWETGLPLNGSPVTILFTVEGASRAFLRFGVWRVANLILWLLLIALGFLVALQIVATLKGFEYARSISSSVSTLDEGVRSILAGDFDHRIRPREPDQMGALATAFNEMSGRLHGLLEERVTHQAMERELAIARDVQARLFPARSPHTAFLEAVGVCNPARVVSGDAYDFVEIPGGWDTIVADVSGKGMSAALLMASLHSALHGAYLGLPGGSAPDPGDILTRLNTHLNQYAEPTRFVTLFLARYCGDGRLVYCNAGHNPGLLLRGGRVEWLASGGLMLGPFADLVYQSATVRVEPDDIVCLYSDGITEAESPSGEQFGEERLARTLRETTSTEPPEIAAALQESVRTWCGGSEPTDDVTLVVLRIMA